MIEKKVRVGVGIILKKENKILLGLRHIDPLEEGYKERENNKVRTWTLPGGKVEVGETLKECAKRETFEETKINIKSCEFVCVNDPAEYNGYFVTVGFISEDFEGEAVVTEPEKVTDWQWFDLENLPSPIFEPSERVIKNYLKKKYL